MGELILLFGVAALYFLNQANAAGHLVFYPDDISSIGFDGASATLLIQNTSNTTFNIASLSGNVFADNVLIGNISSFHATTVMPNTEVPYQLTIKFLPLTIIGSIIDAFQNGHTSKKLMVDGSVNANGVQVPLQLEYSIGI